MSELQRHKASFLLGNFVGMDCGDGKPSVITLLCNKYWVKANEAQSEIDRLQKEVDRMNAILDGKAIHTLSEMGL